MAKNMSRRFSGGGGDVPGSINRQTVVPIDIPRSMRMDQQKVMTSFPAGKIAPLAAIPLYREDAIRTGSVDVTVEMSETAQLLMNAVYMSVQAWFVPFSAFERFNGSMDILDKSYAGLPPIEGGDVIPFIDTEVMGTFDDSGIYSVLGAHAEAGTTVNTAYIEAYNNVVNYRRKNRSPNLAARALDDHSLAPAFWYHQNFNDIVPDFDAGLIEGEVALSVANGRLPVSGIGVPTATSSAAGNPGTTYDSTGELVTGWVGRMDGATATHYLRTTGSGAIGAANVPDIYAELQDNGITLSLANIDLARKTQAFAKMRERFSQVPEQYLIDMLMSGLRIPNQAYRNPMMVGSRLVPFMQSLRYATDSGNLTDSAVNGATKVNIPLRLPAVSSGGILMITAEVTPEQMWERAKDPFLHATHVDEFPDFLRDFLDPQKVDVVTNGDIDTAHATPGDTFGYRPMNAHLSGTHYKLGGKFKRPTSGTANDENRQRFWAAETANPTLGPDFYMSTNINQKPFLDTVADPFEAVCILNTVIEGNTVFGPPLTEAEDNYDLVLEKAPTDRIEP